MPRLWTPSDPGHRDMLLSWVEARLPEMAFERGKSLATAVIRGSKFACVVVYHMRRGVSIEMTNAAATPRWATKEVIAELLAVPFTALGCRRISAVVRADNERAIKFDEGIGFQYEGRLRCAYPDADALIYGMTEPWWRGSKWGQIYRARRPAMERAA